MAEFCSHKICKTEEQSNNTSELQESWRRGGRGWLDSKPRSRIFSASFSCGVTTGSCKLNSDNTNQLQRKIGRFDTILERSITIADYHAPVQWIACQPSRLTVRLLTSVSPLNPFTYKLLTCALMNAW